MILFILAKISEAILSLCAMTAEFLSTKNIEKWAKNIAVVVVLPD